MKFYASVAIAAILMTTQAKAQHVNIGIKGGFNLYNINNSNGVKYDSKPGIHLGLIGHIHLAKQVAFQPEIVYSSQGAKYTTGGVVTKLNLNYVNVPLMLQYMFDNGFRLQAGPQVGFLISAKSKTNDVDTDVKDNLKMVDFGLGFGAGYVHPPSGLGIDIRYNLGLSDINENNAVKSTNRGLQLGVFYLFNHK
ncbi:PorT family protein [Ferruginibacter lapsinanis]|uniref:porin family protein n=1 Tax=Ferruginibacter lapsinanis TaxID=563172 RepID=UPI001E6054D7|nr:porin family protein [Ferruginibacter lapsinanis]UEG50883.1 PorT family protein [Ferruginibacter lapsinanis]